ncbi:hypothetical protein D3C78_1149390 [compost metagenome]
MDNRRRASCMLACRQVGFDGDGRRDHRLSRTEGVAASIRGYCAGSDAGGCCSQCCRASRVCRSHCAASYANAGSQAAYCTAADLVHLGLCDRHCCRYCSDAADELARTSAGRGGNGIDWRAVASMARIAYG